MNYFIDNMQKLVGLSAYIDKTTYMFACQKYYQHHHLQNLTSKLNRANYGLISLHPAWFMELQVTNLRN